MGLAQRYTNLWNSLGFSLYVTLFICYVIATSDKWMKSEMGVGADGYVTVEYWRLSLIRVYHC